MHWKGKIISETFQSFQHLVTNLKTSLFLDKIKARYTLLNLVQYIDTVMIIFDKSCSRSTLLLTFKVPSSIAFEGVIYNNEYISKMRHFKGGYLTWKKFIEDCKWNHFCLFWHQMSALKFWPLVCVICLVNLRWNFKSAKSYTQCSHLYSRVLSSVLNTG